MDIRDLTEEQRTFYHRRFIKYMKDEHDEDFRGNQDSRSRTRWAVDKAWDDALCMDEVKEALNN